MKDLNKEEQETLNKVLKECCNILVMSMVYFEVPNFLKAYCKTYDSEYELIFSRKKLNE